MNGPGPTIDWMHDTQRRTRNYADPTYIGPVIDLDVGTQVGTEIAVTVNFDNVAKRSQMDQVLCIIYVTADPDASPIGGTPPDGGVVFPSGALEMAVMEADISWLHFLRDGAVITLDESTSTSFYLCIVPVSSGIRVCAECAFVAI